jgi:hypothetical protein
MSVHFDYQQNSSGPRLSFFIIFLDDILEPPSNFFSFLLLLCHPPVCLFLKNSEDVKTVAYSSFAGFFAGI